MTDPDISVEPQKLRDEAGKWFDRSEKMREIRQSTQELTLGITAFFPGGLAEAQYKENYDMLLETAVQRLNGAVTEFELIGMTLKDISSMYEDQEDVTASDFTATEEQLEEATETAPAVSPERTPSFPHYE